MRARLKRVYKESDVTDERVYRQRRELLKKMGFIGLSGLLSGQAQASIFDWFKDDEPESVPLRPLAYQKMPNVPSDTMTPETVVTSYNNFYEFGARKEQPAEYAKGFNPEPWTLQIGGLVNSPMTLGFEDLFTRFNLHERIYPLRCVEAWSMVVPWIGFPLADLIRAADPQGSAKFVSFETLADKKRMPGIRNRYLGGGIEYPYVEGLRLDEALHPLSILAVGLYGKSLPMQNGAPIRLVVPWKYGFKSIKSIVSIKLTEQQPTTTWNQLAPQEYGFYANVNPSVDHPRWSQAKERRILGSSLFDQKQIETLPFNGFADQVANLYQGMDLQRFY